MASTILSNFWQPTFLADLPRNPIVAVGLPVVLGSVSGAFTRTSLHSWYPTLEQPPPGPPPSLAFPIVWTTLYSFMGFASHLIWGAARGRRSLEGGSATTEAKIMMGVYWLQLGLNLGWTPLFFGLQSPLSSLIDMSLLIPSVYYLTYKSFSNKVGGNNRLAGWLLLPYAAWISYAGYLNAGAWYLNYYKNDQKKRRGGNKGSIKEIESSEDKKGL